MQRVGLAATQVPEGPECKVLPTMAALEATPSDSTTAFHWLDPAASIVW
jgi:hypothetical protein